MCDTEHVNYFLQNVRCLISSREACDQIMWFKMDHKVLFKFVESMPARVHSVIRGKGEY